MVLKHVEYVGNDTDNETFNHKICSQTFIFYILLELTIKIHLDKLNIMLIQFWNHSSDITWRSQHLTSLLTWLSSSLLSQSQIHQSFALLAFCERNHQSRGQRASNAKSISMSCSLHDYSCQHYCQWWMSLEIYWIELEQNQIWSLRAFKHSSHVN